jgi:hypothetical protein
MAEDNFNGLKKLIEGSGHPVSIKASTILQKKGWWVKNSVRYPSIHEKDVLKEVDIVCGKKSTLFENAYVILTIECKKQKDPWIFFNQKQKNERISTLNVNFAGFYEGYSDYSEDSKSLFQGHFYFNQECCTYFIVGGKNPEKGGPGATIERAINQVYNAVDFYINQSTNDFPEFYYPIIVFDGEIFEASYKDENLEIKSTDHVSLYFEIEYEKPQFVDTAKSKMLLTSKPFIIDIVKLNYLEHFLDFIDQRT